MSKFGVTIARVLVVAVGVVGSAGPLAFAGDELPETERLIRHGVELRRARDDEAAAREFQKAYDLGHTPRAAGQLGLAKQALGLWEDAERFVAEAIRASGDPWVAKNSATLDEALGTIQKHLGRVEVGGDPVGADVTVNGRRVGKLPLPAPVRVSAGEVDIDVRGAGYLPAQRTVTVVGGQYQKITIHLAKAGSEQPPAPPPAPEGAPPPAPAPPGPGPGDTSPSATRKVMKWTAAGLAAAGLVTGVTGAALHSQNVSKFDGHPCRNKSGTGVLPDGTEDATCQSLLNTFRADEKIAIVGFVAAGAFAAAWLALFLTEQPAAATPAAESARRPICAPAATGFGLTCSGSF